MSRALNADLSNRIEELKGAGLFKEEFTLNSPQGGRIRIYADESTSEAEVINLCANNYLGLSNDETIVAAARDALKRSGYGMSSVRFICGTQSGHEALERRLSQFLNKEKTILFSSCFDANTGLFETILGHEDAIISDALNHASIIDGIRLCKAKRFRYNNNDIVDLEAKLVEASECRHRIIATDGVFSMDGIIADLPGICDLAERYDALVMVDDSHAVGFMGPGGRGTPEFYGLEDRVDILTGTFGKALGGASGGYVSSSKEIVDWLRQRSRPYLFSNSLAPVITATTLAVLELMESQNEARERLFANARHFRSSMIDTGFELIPGEHPIIPVMLRDPVLAQTFAGELLKEGVLAVAFSFPVVPKGQDRIRTQMSAAHSTEDVDQAIAAFVKVGKDFSVIN